LIDEGAGPLRRAFGNVQVRRRRIGALLVLLAGAAGLAWRWDGLVEKRVVVVAPGKIVRGAWQRPGPLRTILGREKIRTIVTLTAINQDDPKYVEQARVVREAGVRWVLVPIRGSYATVAEMAEAADLIADPALQPVFFHCVAGHHRSSQVQAAYRIRHEGWSASRAWGEVAALTWARPGSRSDEQDRRLIEAFAASPYAGAGPREDGPHEARTVAEMGPPDRPGGGHPDRDARRLDPPDGELRPGHPRAVLSLGPDGGCGSSADRP
jgi:protein tyrosine phosphatase (PTP) superfamily phosphohydrolase (DUF442 family)